MEDLPNRLSRGEQAEVALIREIEEELRMHTTVRRSLGALEPAWLEDPLKNREIGLQFEIEVEELELDQPPESVEPHLESL